MINTTIPKYEVQNIDRDYSNIFIGKFNCSSLFNDSCPGIISNTVSVTASVTQLNIKMFHTVAFINTTLLPLTRCYSVMLL